MKLSGLGITLRRLRYEDIELVRLHRNSPAIRERMEFRDEISPEQQEEWFRSINNEFNFYFIVEWENKPVGLIYGSDMDWDKKITGNGGIFFWDQTLWESRVPMTAALLLSDFSFIIGLKEIHAYILSDNLRAITFNEGMGYRLQPDQENIYKQQYVLRSESFERKSRKLIQLLSKKHSDVYALELENSVDPASVKFASVIAELPEAQKKRIVLSR